MNTNDSMLMEFVGVARMLRMTEEVCFEDRWEKKIKIKMYLSNLRGANVNEIKVEEIKIRPPYGLKK